MKRKLLQIDTNYFEFPKETQTLEAFIDFVNESGSKFIKMTMCSEEHCVSPFFIAEDEKTVYVNFSEVNFIEEIDGEVMPRLDYECRLCQVVREKCLDCVYFKGDPDNLDGHYERLCLNGHCWGYEKKAHEE